MVIVIGITVRTSESATFKALPLAYGGFMLRPALIESLPELTSPVLTAYLDTNREKAANRALEPG